MLYIYHEHEYPRMLTNRSSGKSEHKTSTPTQVFTHQIHASLSTFRVMLSKKILDTTFEKLARNYDSRYHYVGHTCFFLG